MNSYLTPAGYGTAEIVEKRSRFIGQVWPAETEEAARGRLEEARKQYHDARHNCWCWLLRDGQMRYGDDGEPQGSAGQPMLNVFRASGVNDVCCVVTRYFGGVLLGTGGLARAYAAAAKEALAAAGVQTMALWQSLRLRCPYPLYDRVCRLLDTAGAVTEDTDFGAEVAFSLLAPPERTQELLAALRELSGGTVVPELGPCSFRGAKL